jgi:hypothetical protein
MEDENRIKGAASFFPFESNRKIREIPLNGDDKKKLLDNMWLFNNIPWGNHSNEDAHIILDEPTLIFYKWMDGFDTKTIEIKNALVDNIKVDAIHGFAGNSYGFTFRLGEDSVFHLNDEYGFGFSEAEAKERIVYKLQAELKGLKYRMDYAQSAIDRIK